MATAKFTDAPRGYSKSIQIFLWKKSLTEVADSWKNGRIVGAGKRSASDHASNADAAAAYERRCAALLADGWHDTTFGGRKVMGKGKRPRRASAAKTEAELEALSAELATKLGRARGDAPTERAAIERAVERYRAARTSAGEPPDEFIVHFFAVDGVGLAKTRQPALSRPVATAATRARWLAALERVATPPTARRRR